MIFLSYVGAGIVGFFLGLAGLFGGAQSFGGATSNPSIAAVFETSLAAPLSSSGTALTLASNTVFGGATLSNTYTCFTVDQGTNTQEFMCGTVSGTAVSGLSRGVSPLTGTTTSATFAFAHRRGADVKITDWPALGILNNQLNGIESIPNPIFYDSVSTTTLLNGNQKALADVELVNFVGSSGCANAGESSRGCVQLATQAQMGSSTSVGTSGALLVLQSLYATSSPSAVCGVCTVVTQANGKIISSFINQTSNYTWSGLIAFTNSGTTTFSGGLDFTRFNLSATSTGSKGINLTGGCFALNGTCIGTSVLGLIYSSTTAAVVATSSFTGIPASSYYKVDINIPPKTSCIPQMQFNGDTAANYAYRTTAEFVVAISSAGAKSTIALDSAGTTGLWSELNISNVASKVKVLRSTGAEFVASASDQVAIDTTATWNNTSAQISRIDLGCGTTLPAGTTIKIYGNSDGS